MAYAHELNWYKIPLAKITKPSNTILYGLAGKEKLRFVVESVFDCIGIQVLIVAFHPVVLPTCGNGSNAEDRVCKFHNLLV